MSCQQNTDCIPCQSLTPCVGETCPDVSYTDVNCVDTFPFKCTYWTGSPVSCLGINTGDTGDVVVQKMMAAICNNTFTSPNNKFSINSADTTIGFFNDKISGTFPINFTDTTTSGAVTVAIGLQVSTQSGNQLSVVTGNGTPAYNGLYVAAPTYQTLVASTDTTGPGYLFNKIVAGSNITITKGVNDGTLIIASTASGGTSFTTANTSTIATTLTSGVLSSSLILNSLVLPTPQISLNTYSVTSTGGGAYTGGTISATTGSAITITLEPGASLNISGSTFTYNVPTGSTTLELPTSCTGDWGTILPSNNTSSSALGGSVITTTSTKTITLLTPSSGLNVVGGKVVAASGNDSSSASISIQFKYKYYAGVSTSTSLTSLSDLQGLANNGFTSGGSNVSLTSQITNSTQYYYFCCQFASPLTNVIQNGALPILGAFSQSTITIDNAAGQSTTYYIYRTNAPNPFSSSSTLSFTL